MKGTKKLKVIGSVLVLVVGIGLIMPTAGAARRRDMKYFPEGTPLRAIQDVDDKLDDFRIAPKGGALSEGDEQYNHDLKREIIRGTFDARELSRLALASHWATLTQQKQDEFVDLMISLLEEKALFSKEQSAAKSKEGGKYKIVYRSQKFMDKGETKAFVNTIVLIPSENIDIRLNYKLKKMNGEWKVYDIIVDDASLVSNYRYQFNSIITQHGYSDLVNRMTKKLNEIRGKRANGNARNQTNG